MFDPDDWAEMTSLRDGTYGSVATDLAYDATTAKVFGCFNGDSEGAEMVFGTIDVGTGHRFAISKIETPWIACSVDNNGNLYAVDMEGKLLSVDKIDGKTKELGDLGFKATRRSTGAIDPRTGIFYVVVTTARANDDPYFDFEINVSHLWAVDIKTATARCLYEFEDGEALGGMYIPGPAAKDGAPSQPENLSIDFPNGSMAGTVNFTIPTTTFDGNTATGTVDYLIRANGSLLAEGKAAYGSKITAPCKISEADMYKVDVVLSNNVGRSPKAQIKLWLGPDMPCQLTTPRLIYANGKFELSWTAPAESQHGGYIDPEKISYTVVRNPGNVVVAEKTPHNSFSEAMPLPASGIETYSYSVQMIYDGTDFIPVTSNDWRLGYVALPYSNDFSTEELFNQFTRIDVNGDKTEWYWEWDYYDEEIDEVVPVALYPYTTITPANDWLVSPPVRFEAGHTYKFTYTSFTDDTDYTPSMAIALGTAPFAESLTTELEPLSPVNTKHPTAHSLSVKVDETGLYYIGFHAYGDAPHGSIGISSVTIEADNSGIDRIEADHNAPYTIYTIDGIVTAKGTGAPSLDALPAGLYIVTQGTSTIKIKK